MGIARRTGRHLVAVGFAALALAGGTAPAYAAIPDVSGPDVPGGVGTGTVTDTVDGATGGVGDAVDDATSDVGGGAGSVTDDVSGGVGDAVDGAIGDGTLPGGSGEGPVGDTVDDVTEELPDPVRDTVNHGVETVDSATDGAVDDADRTIGRTLGGLTGAGNRAALEIDRSTTGKLVPASGGAASRQPSGHPGAGGDGFVGSPTSRDARATAEATDSTSTDAGRSLLDAVGDLLVGGLRHAMFPLVLTLAVAAFLVVQGRVGRKDPKLTLAPVDAASVFITFE